MCKKIVAVCMMAVMLLGLFTMGGCQQSNGPSAFAVPETGFNPDEVVEITFTHTMGARLQ